MSNTITVRVPRGVENKHLNITALKVDPDSEQLTLFRGEKLHAVYQRNAWSYFVTEPNEDSGDKLSRERFEAAAEFIIPKSDEQAALDETLPTDNQAILAALESIHRTLELIGGLARKH